jgi:HEAT repeats
MLANESEFEVLLARYDDDPGICSKILRTHSVTEPKVFLEYARKAILDHPVNRALKFIAGVAISAGLMDVLLDLYISNRPQCMALAQKTMACDPRFDVTFLEFLQRPPAGKTSEEVLFHAGLDILDLISEGDRLVPGVLKILKHPNPKVRSKAALFIGSRTQNLAWAASRAQEYDARVRANIIESLYGINSDFVQQIFRNNANDENNRVAGNAVLGLYLLGDTSAIPLIHELARHPDSRFRNTSAWLMGRTGDPRFAQSFSELMNDPDELVRAQAFKGLGEVRKALRASATRPELRAGIVKVSTEEMPHLIATLHDGSGQPVRGLRPTSFILKAGTPARPVRQFTVDEYDCRSSLSVAFVLCLPEQDEAAAEARFVQAIQACNGLRRPKDRWAVVKLGAKLNQKTRFGAPASADAGFRYRQKWAILNVDTTETAAGANQSAAQDPHGYEYSATQPRIDAMLREAPLSIGAGATDEGAKTVLDSLLRVDIAWGNPHLIFLGAGPYPHLVEGLAAKGPDVAATVHVVAQSEAWREPGVGELAAKTGGVYRTAADQAAVAKACFETYSSLLHHYRIGWKDEAADGLELDVYSDSGKGSATYEADYGTKLEPVASLRG